MSQDTKKLLDRAGWPEGSYREIAASEQEEAARAAWPLVAAVNRRLVAQKGRAAVAGGDTREQAAGAALGRAVADTEEDPR